MKLNVLSAHSTVATVLAQPRPAWLVLAITTQNPIVISQMAIELAIWACTAPSSLAALRPGLAAWIRCRSCPAVARVTMRSITDRTAPAYISLTAVRTENGGCSTGRAAAGALPGRAAAGALPGRGGPAFG